MSSSDLASSVNSSSSASIPISSASSVSSSFFSEVATIGTELNPESTQDHTDIKSTQETTGIKATLDIPDITTTLDSDIPKTTQNGIPDNPPDSTSIQSNEMSSSVPAEAEPSTIDHVEDGTTISRETTVTSKSSGNGTTKKTTNPAVTKATTSNASRPPSSAKTPSPTPAPRSSTIIQAVKGESSAVTSTITDQPASTFASLVGVPVTDAAGSTSLSFPPLVTVFSTSQEANGSYVTWTHVVANPTGFLSVDDSSNSFFSKAGQVAGVFLVVGIVAASLMVFLFVSCRRRRARINRRKRWLSGIQRPLPVPDDPFEDPRDPPATMRTINDGASWDGHRRSLIDDENPSPMSAEGPTNGLGLTGVGSGAALTHGGGYNPGYNLFGASYEQNTIGLAISTNREGGQSRPSLAQSSPSIYPPTLPPPDDDLVVYEDIDMGPATLSRSPSGAPPRPPRSHLRDSVVKGPEYFPMTPPPSVSSHGHSPPSPTDPFADPSFSPSSTRPSSAHLHKAVTEDIFNRRTILDVRARPSRDNL